MTITIEFTNDEGEQIKKSVDFISMNDGPVSAEFFKRELDVAGILVGAEALSKGWVR
jgi:hypothetical protein